MKNLYIFGAKFFDILKLIAAINRIEPTWSIKGFLDDYIKRFRNTTKQPYPLLGGPGELDKLAPQKENYFVLNSIGNYRYNFKLAQMLTSRNCQLANLIHPSVDMNMVEIGQGCIIPEGCLVGAYTRIGNLVTCRLRSLISHDVVIEDLAFIGPNATIGGGAKLKKGCFIGTGAIVMGERTIGEGSIVGAGAVVTKDVPPFTTVIGIPAKPMEKKN